jgi:hypothetical protein
MIFKRVVTRARAHLAGAGCCCIVPPPIPLDLFVISLAGPFDKVQAILIVVFTLMAPKVILWNDKAQIAPMWEFELEVHREIVVSNPLMEVDLLLAGNVIQEHERIKLAT